MSAPLPSTLHITHTNTPNSNKTDKTMNDAIADTLATNSIEKNSEVGSAVGVFANARSDNDTIVVATAMDEMKEDVPASG